LLQVEGQKMLFSFLFISCSFINDHNIDHFLFYSILGDSDSCDSSSIHLRQQESSTNNIDDKENLVKIPSLVKEEQPTSSSSSNRRRRSRFDQDSTKSTVEIPSTVNESTPPVIVRKF